MTKPSASKRHLPTSPFAVPVASPPKQFELGDRVSHDRYGLGRIVGAEEGIAMLVDFGGSPASAVIGAHRFYVSARRGGGFKPRGKRVVTGPAVAQSSALIVGDNRMPLSGESDPRAASADPSHALFVGADGRVEESPR